jgi:hypothetical protein
VKKKKTREIKRKDIKGRNKLKKEIQKYGKRVE